MASLRYMANKIVKINACKNATPNSSINIANNKKSKIKSVSVGNEDNKITINPIIICIKVCPAIIFANNRTDSEIVLNKQEKISIGTSKNCNARDKSAR